MFEMASNEFPSSQGNNELIEQLVSITGSSRIIASNILEACNDNLELAVSMLLDQPNVPSTSNSLDRDGVRPPIPPTQEILLPESTILPRLRNKRKVRSVFDGFRDFEAETREQESMLLKTSSNSCPLNKRRTLEDLFRPPIDILFAGNFQMARDACLSLNKWLLVNVQNAQEFACQVLNRDLWSNSVVKSIIKDHFIFWQVYHDSEDGDKYMMFYKVNEWPYISVLDPRTGECLMFWNKIDVTCFCDLITEFVLKNPSPDGSEKKIQSQPSASCSRKSISIIDANEESQMEAAIKASLEADSSKLSNSSSDSELEGFESEDENSSTTPQQNGTNVRKPSDKLSDSWKDFLGSSEDPITELLLRYPDGTKESLKLPCTSKINAVLLFATEKGYSSDKYELLTNFPTRKLTNVNKNTSLSDNGLHPQNTIFIQLK